MAEASRPRPVHAVLGEDTYLAEQALERLVEAAVGGQRQDALRVFDGDETTWEGVLSDARTASLFVSRRAIVVRRADQFREDRPGPGDLPGDRPKKVRDAKHPLESYLEDPAPDVTLVLLAAKPDRRRNPWKKLTTVATVHDASPKKGQALRAHVAEELRRRGLRFAPDAFEDLLGEVGQDLRRLIGEVDKVEAWAGDRKEITADDVGAVLGRGLGQPLYRLSDAFAAADARASLELGERLLGDGEEGLRLLATLHRTLRQVRAAAAMREARLPRAEIGAKLLPPNMQFKLDALLEASRRWTEVDLRRALAALGRADRRMKRGADAATTLVAAVVESCGSLATSPRRGR